MLRKFRLFPPARKCHRERSSAATHQRRCPFDPPVHQPARPPSSFLPFLPPSLPREPHRMRKAPEERVQQHQLPRLGHAAGQRLVHVVGGRRQQHGTEHTEPHLVLPRRSVRRRTDGSPRARWPRQAGRNLEEPTVFQNKGTDSRSGLVFPLREARLRALMLKGTAEGRKYSLRCVSWLLTGIVVLY